MRTPNAPNDADLAAYVAGRLAASRRAEIEHWIASDRANADRVETLRAILTADLRVEPWNRGRMWGNVESAIERQTVAATPSPAPQSDPVSIRRRFFAFTSVAAAVLVVAVGTLFLVRALPERTGSVREYATRRGQRATVQLSDGSHVTLAPDSRLRIADDFGAQRRSVELVGEAQFDVVHDSTRQFSVRAGQALVVDVGTRFDLRAYATDRDARVAVLAGAVTIGRFTPAIAHAGAATSAEGMLVQHGEVGRLGSTGDAHSDRMDNPAIYFAWTDDQLVFTRTPLHEVLETIGRWFDVDVRAGDPTLGDRLVTAEFSTRSPTEMVRALAQAVNATAIDSGRTITLVRR